MSEPPLSPPPSDDQPTARNLLFGLLAFQNGFVDREALLSAFNAWMADKSQSLGSILLDRGALDVARFELMEALVAEHLKQHGGNAEASLAALGSVDSVRHDMSMTADPAVAVSLGVVGSKRPAADATVTFAPSSASRRAGDRFRVLRFHRRGGLGQVHVARDEELGRDVALKEILPEKSDSDMLRSRFILEAEINGGLEHPGIVPVYSLGTYADGKPFYAMRFVEGDSLKDALEAYHRDHTRIDSGSLEFRKLLTRFIDVCETIAYAHSRGVLHRDLKPTNIMLGRFGEALIIDWGLAKATGQRALHASESPEATLLPASGDSHVPTIGVLGSPPYMSPEQANGEVDTLGPATDIYGLGATLYHILTGHPPVQADPGDPLEAVLDKVRRGAILTPRKRSAGIPPALEAITMKALALKPDDRYPSAKSLAEDVEHCLADEPVSAYREPWRERARRWSRRHRTLVTTAAAVLLLGLFGSIGVTAVVTAKNRELAKQTKRAIDREQMAIDAVKRFRDVVVEEPVLKNSPDLEKLRRKLLKEPLAFFKSFREQLQADKETNPDALVRLANAAHDYAHLSQEIGDIEDSLRSHDESLAIWERLVREHPAKSDYEAGIATTENCRGIMLSATGHADRALDSYHKALAIWERLARENLTVTEFQRRLAVIHNNIGELLRRTGKPAAALASHDRAMAIRERLARDNPAVTEFQSDLAASHVNTGLVLSDTGRPAGALAAYEKAMAIWVRLARDNPTVSEYQNHFALIHYNVGHLLSETGKPAEALAAYEKARVIQERLARENPTRTEFQSDLAQSHNNIGMLLGITGKPAEALAVCEKAMAIFGWLAWANPTVTEFQRDLAASHTNIGNLLSEIGKPAEALAAHEKAMAIRERLARENPAVTEFQSHLAASHNNVGALLINTGKPTEALAAYEKALAILKRLARENPTVANLQSDLAYIHFNIGNRLMKTGKPAEALAAYENARAIWELLVRENPTVTEFQSGLAGVHANIGNVLRGTGRPVEALAAFEKATAIQQRLASEHPKSPDYASNLGAALHNLATLDLDSKRFQEAKTRLRQAVGWQRKALAASPSNPTYRQFMANHLTSLTLVARGLGDAEGVAQAERELAELRDSDPAMKELDSRLAEISRGNTQFKGNRERLQLAQRAYEKALHATAAKLWAEALEAEPKLTEDRQAQHRYNAACAAALAGCGEGKDEKPPDEAARARLREQARGWLQSELTAWAKLVESAPTTARPTVAQTLNHWKQDADLAGVRDPAGLAKLPDDERKEWNALWSQVDALLAEAQKP